LISLEDTIVACSSPLGVGAISSIRVSGPDSREIYTKISGKELAHFNVIIKEIPLAVDIKEKCVLTSYKNPNSYTGEDSFEICCHGNPLIVDLIIDNLISLGCRLAEPGEFTMRSFLNSKIGLVEAEAISDLIHAETLEKVRAVGRSLKGEFTTEIDKIILNLREIRTLVESEIDFNDQEINIDFSHIKGNLEAFSNLLSSFISTTEEAVFLNEGINTVITGPTNVGKSSLMNYLSKNETSIVSEISGTTRDLISKSFKIGNHVFNFYDTAGITEDSSDPIERKGISMAEKALLECDLVIELVDDENINYKKIYPNKKVLRVINKIDKFENKDVGLLGISLKTRANLESLEGALIKTAFRSSKPNIKGFSARSRHLGLLRECYKEIESASGMNIEDSIELFAEHLKLGSLKLGQIKDPYSSDDLLGDIFANFCIGK
jgi:tRNA modification GTPase